MVQDWEITVGEVSCCHPSNNCCLRAKNFVFGCPHFRTVRGNFLPWMASISMCLSSTIAAARIDSWCMNFASW